MRKTTVIAITLLVLVMLSVSFYFLVISKQSEQYVPSIQLSGAEAPQFMLTDQFNNKFDFSSTKGKVTLIYFGYTNCPDICPVVMSKFAYVKNELGEESEKVEMIMITTDPNTDTPKILNEYIKKYDERIIGVTGEYEEMEQVWKKFKIPVQEKHDGMNMAHFSLIIVTDKNHSMKFALTPEMSEKEYLESVKSLL
tara:strand:+ start:508 stop:1095 length:588 start_codon:yes stop_codon:yes gene_type:complete